MDRADRCRATGRGSPRKPVVGLIGGVGSGKSTVARVLAEMGGAVIDADELGHAMLREPEVRDAVVGRWGPVVLRPDGQVDRSKLAAIVFRDRGALAELERIMHPRMKQEIRRRVAEAQARPEVRLVVLDAAVLFEAGWADVCDCVVFVEAPRTERLARVGASRGWGPGELDQRERSQIDLTEKRRRADMVLDNSASPVQTRARVAALVETLTEPATAHR